MTKSSICFLLGGMLTLTTHATTAGTYVNLDGNTGSIATSSTALNLAQPFTVEAWVRPDRLVARQDVFTKWSSGNFPNQRSIYFQIFNNQVQFVESTDGTQTGEVGITSAASLAPGQWVHLAGVHTGSEMDLYINGVKDASTIATTAFPFAGTSPLMFGSGGVAGATFENLLGGIEEVRISKGARYTANFIPSVTEFASDANTLLLYHLDEGSGPSAANLGISTGVGTLSSGATWATGSPVNTPEPASLSLVLLLGVFCCRRTTR